MMRNTAESWGTVARLLHWLVAVLVIVQIGLGWAAVAWRLSPLKLDLFVLHKSFGLVVLLLMLLRLLWRLAGPAPALPAGMSGLQRAAAGLSHLLLYLVLLALPLSGWVLSSAANIPFRVFWRLPLPALVAPDKAVETAAAAVHLGLVLALSALLLLHVGAALWHHFVRRDTVLTRMLTGRTPP